jgi:hypothetical protein
MTARKCPSPACRRMISAFSLLLDSSWGLATIDAALSILTIDNNNDSQCTVTSAVSRPFRMSRYALDDCKAMFDAINYQVTCKSNWRPNFILHVLCHPGLHFHSLSMKCDVERTALSRGYSMCAVVLPRQFGLDNYGYFPFNCRGPK